MDRILTVNTLNLTIQIYFLQNMLSLVFNLVNLFALDIYHVFAILKFML